MNPTHIIIPMDSLVHAIQVFELTALHRPLSEIDKEKLQYLKDIRDSEQSIKVDLSKEGIEEKFMTPFGDSDYPDGYNHGYKQCVYDLLHPVSVIKE